jgi:acyl-CoA synthetase (AMP-forming)/AMP-acid ligase II
VLCDEELVAVVGEAMAAAGLDGRPVVAPREDSSGSPPPAAPPAELALLQFTSGSSGRPRGVRVSRANLEAMIGAMVAAVAPGPQDALAHWLPLFHDFGLIACCLTPAVLQRDVWVLRPEQFLIAPQRWLDCLGRFRATFSMSPPFGFSYLLAKVGPEALRGCDFSGWCTAIVGAERIDAGVLSRAAGMLAPFGFRAEAFVPAYGLAEATLAVTLGRTGVLASAVHPDWSSLRMGEPVVLSRRTRLAPGALHDGAGWIVGCGTPVDRVRVDVVDEAGSPLPPGHLGEIRVGGATVARGYLGEADAGLTRFDDGGLQTADAGFLHDGQLYVVGRLGDAIAVRGRSVYAEDLEARLVGLPGIRPGRCCVVPAVTERGTALVAIVERRDGEVAAARAAATLRGIAGSETRVEVVVVAPGTIPRTSSGKPRRRLLAQRLLDGSVTRLALAEVG